MQVLDLKRYMLSVINCNIHMRVSLYVLRGTNRQHSGQMGQNIQN